MLKVFLNNKKIRIISLLFHENEFATDFKKKAELFHSFFAKHVHQPLSSQATIYYSI